MLAAEADEQGVELEAYLEEAALDIPNGRVATPEEVAALALFLASDVSSHITGTAIPIDGGGSA